MAQFDLVSAGIITVLIGTALIFAGVISKTKNGVKVEGGGVVFIGPIPIIGATSERSLYLVIAISIIFLFALMLVNFLGR